MPRKTERHKLCKNQTMLMGSKVSTEGQPQLERTLGAREVVLPVKLTAFTGSDSLFPLKSILFMDLISGSIL